MPDSDVGQRKRNGSQTHEGISTFMQMIQTLVNTRHTLIWKLKCNVYCNIKVLQSYDCNVLMSRLTGQRAKSSDESQIKEERRKATVDLNVHEVLTGSKGIVISFPCRGI